MTTHVGTKPSRRSSALSVQAMTYSVAGGLSQILVSIAYLLTARNSTPAEFGAVVSATAVGTVLAGLIDFGANSYWTRESANGRMTAAALSSQAGGKAIVAVSVAAVLGTVGAMMGSAYWFAAPLAVSITLSQTITVPLRARQLPARVLVATLTDKSVCLAVLLVAMSVGVQPGTALWVSLVTGSLVGSSLAAVATPRGSRLAPWSHRPRFPWRESRHFGVFGVAVGLQGLDVTVLERAAGAASAGDYGAVSRWTQPLTLVARSFATALGPVAARSTTTADAWQQLKRAAWLWILALLGAGSVFMFAPLIVGTLLGSEYQSSVDVLRLLAIVAAFSILNQPLISLLQARGFDGTIAMMMACVVTAQFAILVPATLEFGALGAAFASLVSQFILFVAAAVLVSNKVRSSASLQRTGGN